MYKAGDWVKEDTATAGTGTVTLTQKTGFSRFSDVFTVGDIVYYTIQDGDNRETGIGTVSAGNTLARTTIQATLVSGVYDDTSPTAITLSGNATVYATATANMINGKLPKFDGEPNGFPDRTEFTIGWSDVTRTLSLTPVGASFQAWSNGNLYVYTSAESIAISDVEGSHYIYFDSNGVIQEITSFNPDIINTWCFIAYVYWDATNKEAITGGVTNETHSSAMPPSVHSYLHNVMQTQYIDGLTIGGITADGNGSLDSHAQFTMTTGTIYDEDIPHTIAAKTNLTDTFHVIYKDGAAGNWRQGAASSFPVLTTGTGRAAYNQWTGTTWQLTEVSNNDFVLAHVAALGNDGGPADFVVIMGENAYSTLNVARTGATTELADLNTTGIPSTEWVFVATIILQTSNTYVNTVKSAIVSTENGNDYVDWRLASSRDLISSSTSPADHNSLAGLQGGGANEYYHLTAAEGTKIDNITVTNPVNLDNITNTATATLTNKTIDDLTNLVHANAVHKKVENVTASTMPAGTAVAFSDYDIVNSRTEVVLADNTTGVSIGLVDNGGILAGAEGTIIVNGVVTDVDTNAWTEGTILYVSTGGALTATEPTTGFQQPIAFVIKQHLTEGILQVNASYPKQDASDVRFTAAGDIVATDVQAAIVELDNEKVALTEANQTITGNLNITGSLGMQDNLLTRAILKDTAEELQAHGNMGATETFDCTTANVHTATADATVTITFSNPPATGDAGYLVIFLTNGGSQTITFPTSVDWPGGTAPTLTASGLDILTFVTYDAGTTWLAANPTLDVK